MNEGLVFRQINVVYVWLLFAVFSFLYSIQREQGATGLVFHASGLLTGQSYALRVVLFERSNALAVSMRSFRIGAVSISDGVEVVSPVTIQVRFLHRWSQCLRGTTCSGRRTPATRGPKVLWGPRVRRYPR